MIYIFLITSFLSTVSFAVTGCGMALVWTSPALAYLQSAESEIPITKWQSSWINSLLYAGIVCGCAVVPFIIDRLGRKYTYLLFSLFQVFGWLLIIFAQNFSTICAARFCHGFAESALFDFISIYIAEIAEKRIRGILGTILKVSAFLGIFYVGMLGAFVSYKTMNLMCIPVPLIFLSTFPFMPESPYFCLMKGRDEEAEKILMKFRGLKKLKSVKLYIESIKEAMRESKQVKKNTLMDLLSTKIFRKCLVILFFAKATKMLSGAVTIGGYTQSIFSATGFKLEPKYSAVVIYGTQLFASIMAVGFVDRVNRRTLFLISGITCTICLISVGLFFFVKDQLKFCGVFSISWVPLASLILYELGYCSGIGPISYIIPGEIFPVQVKGTAVNLGVIMENLWGFVIGLVFYKLNATVGIYGTFWIFAVCCLIGSISLFCTMPETRGKSLEEIQHELQCKKKWNSLEFSRRCNV